MEKTTAITCRSFAEGDLQPVRALILKTIDISYADDYSPAAIAFFKKFHADHKIRERAHSGTVLVAEQNGAIVATASLRRTEIFAVFVDPGHQGRGYGRHLMHALEEKARASGVTQISLSVSLPSRLFYESLGYKMVEERVRQLEGGCVLRFWAAEKLLCTESQGSI